MHDISLSPFIVPLLECFSLCVVKHFSNARYSRRRTYVLLRTSMAYTALQCIVWLPSLQPRHTRVSARPLALSQPRTPHDPSLHRSHPPLPPRLEENEVHQLLRVRFRCSRFMMTISPARENTQAMSAMAINSWGIEAFACVWAGGTCLVAGAGHVAAGGPPDRQADRGHQPASAAMAHACRGLGHRPFGPGQIMPGLKRPSLRRCGR